MSKHYPEHEPSHDCSQYYNNCFYSVYKFSALISDIVLNNIVQRKMSDTLTRQPPNQTATHCDL